MTLQKRIFDLLLAIALIVVLAVPFALLVIFLRWKNGSPVFYVAERMKTPEQSFRLWKLRTMTNVDADSGVSGGDKAGRITPVGRFLRRSRLDEVPQLWNVLRGDISFVGPRPPLRIYVERFPALYAQVLQSRPGITGLASLHFHAHEEWVLAQCATAEETDAAYSRRCVGRKAEMDLIYQRNQSLCFDISLLWRTVTNVLVRRLMSGRQ